MCCVRACVSVRACVRVCVRACTRARASTAQNQVMEKVVTHVAPTVTAQRVHDANRLHLPSPGLVGRVTGLVGRVTGLVGRVTGLVGRVTGLASRLHVLCCQDRDRSPVTSPSPLPWLRLALFDGERDEYLA